MKMLRESSLKEAYRDEQWYQDMFKDAGKLYDLMHDFSDKYDDFIKLFLEQNKSEVYGNFNQYDLDFSCVMDLIWELSVPSNFDPDYD